MISRPKARDQFLFLVCKLQTWLKLSLRFLPDHFRPNFLAHQSLAPQCEKQSRGCRQGGEGGIYQGIKIKENQDDIDEEKRADDRDKEKKMNHDKGKNIRKRRRGLRQG